MGKGSQTFGLIGDASVAHRIAEGDGELAAVHFPGGTLGPGAASWAHSLLAGARFELARADDKASTLFRFYGVVAALSIGLLAGRSWSPTNLQLGGEIVFWAGCATLLASGFFLGISLYPREVRGTSPARATPRRLRARAHEIRADAQGAPRVERGHGAVHPRRPRRRLDHARLAALHVPPT